MTGREAVMYILENGHDDKPLVINADGKAIRVYDIVYESTSKALVVLPDHREDQEGD